MAKVLKILSPILFWCFLVVSFICLCFAIKNSFGNVAEIIDLLNSKEYTGEELKAHYEYLVEKYGEWQIGTGGAGFQITFINIKTALFSGIMIMNVIFSVIFLASAFLAKWILPKLSAQILNDNQDMVNLMVLKSQENNKKE